MKQIEIRMLGEPEPMRMLPDAWIKLCKTRHDAILLCFNASGLTNSYIAEACGIAQAQFTRITKGVAHFPDKKDDRLMEVCRNYAPMQYEAMACGFQLYQDPRAKREAELEAELIAIRRQRLGEERMVANA